MMIETSSTSSQKTAACICGKRHRAGTVCAVAERLARQATEAQAVLEALRQLPAGTVTLLDTRGTLAKARTLAAGAVLVRRYADGCEDTDWGTVAAGVDGEVRYQCDNGGFVPNSYKYAAATDWMRVAAAEGRVVVIVSRTSASRRPHGQGTVVDYLLGVASINSARVSGVRYLAAWVVAAKAQARLERLSATRAACSPAEVVEVDAALEAGFI